MYINFIFFCLLILFYVVFSLNNNENDLTLQKNNEKICKNDEDINDTKAKDNKMRKLFIGGNWKCNGKSAEVAELVNILNNGGDIPANNEVIVAVPAIHIGNVKQTLRSDIAVSAQNVAVHSGVGAYTGEISGELLKDFGVDWTIVGHSERRAGFEQPGETNEIVGKKTKNALAAGLKVILCIGETLTERETGQTKDIILTQLQAVFDFVSDPATWNNIVIAYEPVWAIGTGKVATIDQIVETHGFIRQWLTEKGCSDEIRIIYGGSVKGSNCNDIIKGKDVDGFLVGGASLLPEFNQIMRVQK